MPDRYDENGNITESAHKSDHAYIKEIKDKAQKRQELIDKVQASLITAFIWSLISGVAAIIWYAFNKKLGV